jgi:hypothetical protein
MAITDNMRLVLPTPLPSVTATPGPKYANENNDAFYRIDSHNHTLRRGVPVPTAAINITADLPFNDNSISLNNASYLLTNPSPLISAADYNSTYSSGDEWYYTDGNGVGIKLTDAGALNIGSAGGIGGDYVGSTASVFYSLAATKFFFTQSTNIAAKMDFGSLTLRSNGASANGVTIKSPLSLASSYNITFPAALPASTKILNLNSSGVVGFYDVDNTSIEVAANQIQVKDLGVTTAKIAAAAVTPVKFGPLLYAESASCSLFSFVGNGSGTYTSVSNLSVSFTSPAGRPVVITLNPAGGGDASYVGTQSNNWYITSYLIRVRKNGSALAILKHDFRLGGASTSTDVLKRPACVKVYDFSPGTGSNTYDIQVLSNTSQPGQNTSYMAYYKLVVYEEI